MATKHKIFVLDTNVLIHDPNAILRFHEHDVYIPIVVLEELDKIKVGLSELARNVRQVSRLIDSLPEVRVPTLVVVGADDTDFLPAAEVMARKIPGAAHVVIPQAGHGANVDQPGAFNRAILDFLAQRL